MATIWKLKSTSRVPPGGNYVYTQKETGVTLKHHSLYTLINLVKRHREANRIKVEAEIDFEIEQHVCEQLIKEGHPNLCQQVFYNNTNQTKEIAFLKSKGASVVDDETLQRRLDACMGNKDKNIERCKKWIEATDSCQGCQSCGSKKLLKLTRKIVSTRCPLNKWK